MMGAVSALNVVDGKNDGNSRLSVRMIKGVLFSKCIQYIILIIVQMFSTYYNTSE